MHLKSIANACEFNNEIIRAPTHNLFPTRKKHFSHEWHSITKQ